MDASKTLVTQVIQTEIVLLADHMRVLRQHAFSLIPVRAEFVAQWHQIWVSDPRLSNVHPSTELVDSGTRILVDVLNSKSDPGAYLSGIAVWCSELVKHGANFADATRLVMTYRRALLPLLLRTYSAGSEMELLFRALDAQEHAFLGIFAAVQIEETQEQMIQGAHQRSVGRLTGGVAHALNNTMAILVGRTQILEEQIDRESVRQELRAIQKIAHAGADSLKLLQQFAADRETQGPTRLDVNLMINDVVQLTRFRWRDDAEASGIAIDVVKDLVPVPPVLGQSVHLRDALVELILNSVEAMPLGGLVTIRTDSVEDRVQIALTDQGEGMDPATQAQAVEAFFTTKGSGHVGLGLPAVAATVRKMGGKFSLTSVAGQGTTALISLPAASEIKQAPDLHPARLARWANILIVDDEPLVRDVATRTFQLRGFRTAAAESGSEAIHSFSTQGPFEVVLVDLGMPGMNGFDTARAIKDINPRTIVILMTGRAAELEPKKMREAGIDRAVSKPYDVDQVIQLISEALAFQEQM